MHCTYAIFILFILKISVSRLFIMIFRVHCVLHRFSKVCAMMVRKIRGQIIRTVPCCIVYRNIVDSHLISTHMTNSRTRFRFNLACYAEPCISYDRVVRMSICLSVCHTLALCQNDARLARIKKSTDSPSSLGNKKLIEKFERAHPKRRR